MTSATDASGWEIRGQDAVPRGRGLGKSAAGPVYLRTMPGTRVRPSRRVTLCLLVAALASCGPPDRGGVDDEASARLAYLGLDRAIDRAIDLGFAGFNAASNANIPEQSDAGELGGVMTVGGQVDQGNSDNKGMRLDVTLTEDYSDVVLEGEVAVVYNGGPAALDMNFKGLPDADLSGTLGGTFTMTGDLVGTVQLDLSFTGATEEAPDGAIVRTAGTVHVTGTATSDYGVYPVDVML